MVVVVVVGWLVVGWLLVVGVVGQTKRQLGLWECGRGEIALHMAVAAAITTGAALAFRRGWGWPGEGVQEGRGSLCRAFSQLPKENRLFNVLVLRLWSSV